MESASKISNYMSATCDTMSEQSVDTGHTGTLVPFVDPNAMALDCRIDKTLERYKCMVCEKKFQDGYDLRRHLVVHTKDQPFLCHKCPRKFTQKTSLNKHLLIHERLRNFQCSHCPMKFVQKVNLNTHIKQVHSQSNDPDDVRYHCKKCPSVFKRNGLLKIHRARIHGEMVMLDSWVKPTSNVSRTATSSSDESMEGSEIGDKSNHTSDEESEIMHKIVHSRRSEHMLGKTKSRQHVCNICQAAFIKIAHLSQHLTSHLGIRAYRCNVCNKSYASKQSYDNHIKLHSQSIQQFSCDKCEETFNRKATLKRHTVLHEGLKHIFRCPYCHKSFRWTHNCKAHIQIFHSTETSQDESLLQPIKESTNEKQTVTTNQTNES